MGATPHHSETNGDDLASPRQRKTHPARCCASPGPPKLRAATAQLVDALLGGAHGAGEREVVVEPEYALAGRTYLVRGPLRHVMSPQLSRVIRRTLPEPCPRATKK